MSDDPVTATRWAYDQGASDYIARNSHTTLPELFAALAPYVPPSGLILDIGAGPGWHTLQWIRRGRRAIALDLSLGMLSEAQRLGVNDALQADMRRLPLASHCADALWVCASFLHVPREDAPATLAEFARVLKPGGAMYLGVKSGRGERDAYPLAGAPRYFVFWDETDLDAALCASGFRIVRAWASAPEQGATRADPWINRVVLRT